MIQKTSQAEFHIIPNYAVLGYLNKDHFLSKDDIAYIADPFVTGPMPDEISLKDWHNQRRQYLAMLWGWECDEFPFELYRILLDGNERIRQAETIALLGSQDTHLFPLWKPGSLGIGRCQNW